MGFGNSKMLFRNKKAEITFVTVLIIAMVSFFVLGGVIKIFVAQLPKESADAICKISVAKRAQTTVSVAGGAYQKQITPLLCQTQEFTIDGRGKTKQEVLTEFMDYAARAWNVWGEGQFSGGLYDNFIMYGSDGCYRYYNIKLKNIPATVPKEDVIHFMKNNIYQKMNTTYWDYIAQSSDYSGFNIFDDLEDQHIYSIIIADIKVKTGFIGAVTEGKIIRIVHFNEMIVADINTDQIVTGVSLTPMLPILVGVPMPLVIVPEYEFCKFISGTGGE